MIHAERANFPVTRMVQLLGVSRAGYYAWVRRLHAEPGLRAARRAALTEQIKDFHEASAGVNGSPRILADLRQAGEVVSRKTVAKIMREQGIVGISPRPWTPATTISGDSPHTIPDLVNRVFDTGQLNRVWTSDITYLDTWEGWLYLCAVRDGCSRRVLGYAFSDSLHTDLVETALRRAVAFRDADTGPTSGVVFHADRGCQYTSAQMAAVAAELDVRQSVGRTGVCWDNAQQESFWSTLKTEFYNRHVFATKAEAITAVSRWIDTVYNTCRRHSALGQISPIQFETQHTTAAREAA